jgi:hypothetical protein
MAIAIYMISNVNNCIQKVTRVSGSGFTFWPDRGSLAAALSNPLNDEKQAELACRLHADPGTSKTIIFTEKYMRYADSSATCEVCMGSIVTDPQLFPEWRLSVCSISCRSRQAICIHTSGHRTFRYMGVMPE